MLVGNAVERLQEAGMKRLFVSNSLTISSMAKAIPFISVFDIHEDIVSVLKEKLDGI